MPWNFRKLTNQSIILLKSISTIVKRKPFLLVEKLSFNYIRLRSIDESDHFL